MSDVQQGPADETYRDLADVEHFFSSGLNMTMDEAREWVDNLRAAMRWSQCARGHDHSITIEYDGLADLVDAAERLVQMWEDETHLLEIKGDGFSMQHPIACRGDLLSCPYWTEVTLAAENGGEILSTRGTFRIEKVSGNFGDSHLSMRMTEVEVAS